MNGASRNAAARPDAAALETIRDSVDRAAVGRVFGEAVRQDGVTVVPVARVSGGGGGGGGAGPSGQESGSGGGFGVTARPVGVFVIQDGAVSWRPAIDLNKIILGGQIVLIAALLTIRALIKARVRS